MGFAQSQEKVTDVKEEKQKDNHVIYKPINLYSYILRKKILKKRNSKMSLKR